MKYNPAIHHRRSIRLPDFDYARPGAYFVTICTQDRACILGDIVEAQTVATDIGRMVESIWREMPGRYRGVNVDAFVVMPNHVHGIVVLVGAGPCACPDPSSSSEGMGQPRGVAPTTPISLPVVVHRFKSLTATRYRKAILVHKGDSFPDRLWQRNYYEHVIRDEQDLRRARQYIVENPSRWEEDSENPAAAAL